MVYTIDGGCYLEAGLRTIGLDAVTALEFLKKHPEISAESRFDCIRPHVNLMLAHQKEGK